MEQEASPSNESVLGEDDLSLILQELEPVAHMWREIGLVLGLRDSTLERIARGQGDEIVLLRIMIAKWLKMKYNVAMFGAPTWRNIVKAVRASTGGDDPTLADELAEKYRVTTIERQPAKHPSTLSDGTRITNSTLPRHVHRGIFHCCCYMIPSPAHALSDLTENDMVMQSQMTDREITLPRRASETSSTLPGYSKSVLTENIEQSMTVSAHPTWQIKDITQQRGYWGAMTKESAEKNLKECGGNCYLIRYSESNEHFVISVMRTDVEKPSHMMQHYKLCVTKGKDHTVYEIEGTENVFTSFAELLDFYQTTPLTRSNRTIGNVCTKVDNNCLSV